MERPQWSQFGEIRRLLPLLAAALLVVALFFPMWHIRMDAVQYPSETLTLGLYAYPRISGDYVEIARLNHYIGFYYPDPVFWPPNYEPHPDAIDVPEWSFGPLAFVGVAATSLFVAVAPTARKLRRGLTAQLVGSVLVFTVLLADIQYRLYQAGHTLDPDAPVMGVDPFTPPLWGKYAVANITSYSRFGVGAYLTVAAIGLLLVAWAARDSTATVDELPRIVRGLPTDSGTESGGGR
ncbi:MULTISPECIES: hypothetical protein [Halolamina]|uniref:Uncharacterized protein n=1 Tax=Halolamina pelagica TaxID=699431 RepID=A0A1I5MUL0_9EURY|nr:MULTISPECIES: hypothetical protein [Halolamina]NHX36159.1 hypothetical protein [Halolamina sp. R1-12]SFP13027.1 hypothetical protein SAMN05216277_101405 [Halolamina pelagica]